MKSRKVPKGGMWVKREGATDGNFLEEYLRAHLIVGMLAINLLFRLAKFFRRKAGVSVAEAPTSSEVTPARVERPGPCSQESATGRTRANA